MMAETEATTPYVDQSVKEENTKETLIPAEYVEKREVETLRKEGYKGEELKDIIEDMDIDFDNEDEVIKEGLL